MTLIVDKLMASPSRLLGSLVKATNETAPLIEQVNPHIRDSTLPQVYIWTSESPIPFLLLIGLKG